MTTMRISDIIVRNRHREDMGDLDSLAASIQRLGLLQSIVVRSDKVLVAGERRLRACREILKWPEIDVRVIDLEQIVEGEFDENTIRKDFTVSERVAIGKEIEALLGNRQGQRTDKTQASKPNNGHGEQLPEKIPEVERGKETRQAAAEKAGFGNAKTYEQAKKVVEKAAPEVVKAVDKGQVSISDAASIADQPKPVQKKAAKKVKEGKAKTLKQAVADETANGHAEPEVVPETPKDKLGIPIQPHAAEAFESVEKFDQLLKELRRIDKEMSALADGPGGAFLRRPGIMANARDRWKHAGIGDAIRALEDCRPTYTDCPRKYHSKAFPDAKREKHDESCNLCHGIGWSRALGKNEVQAEVLEAMKAAYGVSDQE